MAGKTWEGREKAGLWWEEGILCTLPRAIIGNLLAAGSLARRWSEGGGKTEGWAGFTGDSETDQRPAS